MSIYGKVPVRDLRNVERRERSLMGLTSIWHWSLSYLLSLCFSVEKERFPPDGDLIKACATSRKVSRMMTEIRFRWRVPKTLSSEQPFCSAKG